MDNIYLLSALGLVATVYLTTKAFIRLQLSKAKHPSLRGHSKWSRRIAGVIKFFDYNQTQFFNIDNAPQDIVEKRQAGLAKLVNDTQEKSPKTLAYYQALEKDLSDVQFTSQYRIPFPFRTQLPHIFKLGSIIEESKGVQVKDLDGNWRYDIGGSYGVNVFGYQFYKECIAKGAEKVQDLGPALGSYHPVITENVKLIKEISKLDEVSFHMSGTEAVMQAVRLARYHTQKTHLVRFCGAYHGWWDGVQPGIGNRRNVDDVYTLAALSEKALTVLDTRKDIACVLINPLQAFHPNSDSASDASLIASDRNTNFNKQEYSQWLKRIRDICTRRNIVLIFDEVFTGFRLGYRGAQEYFDVNADLVTYGKTLGGGLPVGVLAGRSHLMKRFKENEPLNVSLARGTFNSHPYVMGAMNEFLNRLQSDEIKQLYRSIESTWEKRVAVFNKRLAEEKLPIRITQMHTILSVIYTQPNCYNWLLQFYLKNNGLELSWLGTGRFIMSFNFNDDEFHEVMSLFIKAAKQMRTDGWFYETVGLTNKAINCQFLHNMLAASFPILRKFLPHATLAKNTHSVTANQPSALTTSSPEKVN